MKCSLCEKKSMMGVGVPFFSKTESGEIVDIYTTKDSSVSVSIPLCPFHMIFVEHGLIAVCGDGIHFLGRLTVEQHMNATDSYIKEQMKEIKNDPDYSIAYAALKGILAARKFEKVITKNG